MTWRFDQGRLQYFQLDEVRNLARGLAALDGGLQPTGDDKDIVRDVMGSVSDQPFLPTNYFVWRNYGRVFECLLLATVKQRHILATDLCKKLAYGTDLDSDDYLAHFAKNFYYPSPIFQGYDPVATQTFPVVAIIKFLFSEYLVRGKDYITVDEIGDYLIGNNVTGEEDLSFYATLKNTKKASKLDLRQTRELVKFISQFSFLKWDNPKLYLEAKQKEELFAIEKMLIPIKNVRKNDAAEEIVQMGGGSLAGSIGDLTIEKMGSGEEEFTEGRKVRVTHLRTERSSRLKTLYFRKVGNPTVCRMCDTDTVARYPWTDHVIELHHLLPLSSPVRVEGETTSVADLVGLCPSCHRATHRFYSKWLKANKVSDFKNHSEAVMVYNEAKSKVVLA